MRLWTTTQKNMEKVFVANQPFVDVILIDRQNYQVVWDKYKKNYRQAT